MSRLRRLPAEILAFAWGATPAKRQVCRADAERSEAKNVRPHERAVVLGSQKLILGPGGESELYDLASDPDERRPAAASDATRSSVDRALAEFGTRMARESRAAASVPLDEEAQRRLKALGYVR